MVKAALVTGAGTGIGKAIALKLATEGYNLVVHYRTNREAAEQVCEESISMGVKAIALSADITDPTIAKSLVKKTYQVLGELTVIVNNVGSWLSVSVSQLTVEQWRGVLDSNLNATYYITHAALPYLRAAGYGRIVNIAAAGAQHVMARGSNAAYMIAKTGIIIYTKSLAKELAAENITVNVISPGIAENSFEYNPNWQGVKPKLPIGRPAKLEEIAQSVWYFISPEAEYITGQVLEVAGGWGL